MEKTQETQRDTGQKQRPGKKGEGKTAANPEELKLVWILPPHI